MTGMKAAPDGLPRPCCQCFADLAGMSCVNALRVSVNGSFFIRHGMLAQFRREARPGAGLKPRCRTQSDLLSDWSTACFIDFRDPMRILILTLGLTVLPTSSDFRQTNSSFMLRDLVASGVLSDLRWPDFSVYRTRVESFYQPAGYALAWTRDGAITDPGKVILARLQQADVKGLDAEDYDGARWADRVAKLGDGTRPPSASELARFDLALTVSLMRYASDVHLGRANPGLFHASFDLARENGDLPSFIHCLVNATDVNAVLDSIEPPYKGYWRAQRALRRYMTMARETAGGTLPVPKKAIEPGQSYSATAQLAGMLRRLGDLSADAKLPMEPAYEGELVDAVKHFESRHGLDPDGRLGKATLAQLNTPLTRRVRQLELTLERWRWVPHAFPRPPIVVNIPEFKLRGLNCDYTTELEMKVVVGKAFRHQTPVFSAEMKYVVFRPYWDVPRSIQLAEVVPKLNRDRAYLRRNGYEVIDSHGKVVTSGVDDDATLVQLYSGKLRVRQTPGSRNALGPVKFLFPNKHNVYLHGTPQTELFSMSRRDFSHGCIRVEQPDELAAWVLRDRAEWTPEHILDAMHGKTTIEVTLKEPIPVLIVYATAVALQDEVRFFEDIYGLDKELEERLAKSRRKL